MSGTTRRQLAKGALWSVPVIAVASAAPAFAAPGCQPGIRASFGSTYDFGVIGDRKRVTTSQVLQAGGQTWVYGLPDDVTVESIAYEFWFAERKEGTVGPGMFPSSSRYSDKPGTQHTDFAPTPGSGFSNVVVTDKTGVSKQFPDGITRTAWNLKMSWSAAKDTLKQYTTGPQGCQVFTTGPSMKYTIKYRVTGLNTQDVREGKKSIPSFATATATLSNGQTLTVSYNVAMT